MSEYIVALLGIAVTIVIAYYSHQQQQKVIRQQVEEIEELKKGRRRELIEKYYPPLAENLRLSLPDMAYRYVQGFQEHGHYFDKLIDMANDSTLKFIQGLDEKLYVDLMNILDHFIPSEKVIDQKKDESWKEVPTKWQKWFEDNHYELPKVRGGPKLLAQSFSDSIIWALWRNDEPLLRQNFDRIFTDRFIIDVDDPTRFWNSKDWVLNELVRLSEEEWKPIKDEYEKLQEELKNLVTLEILPRMDATLRSLGE